MIAQIRGNLKEKHANCIIVDVNGVGYGIFISLATFYQLPALGELVELQTYTYLREDTIQLYGFFTREEKELFQLLIGVNKVGPRLARNILSGLSPAKLRQAIATEDLTSLSHIPKVGRKMAQRLVMELRDKITPAEAAIIPADSQLKQTMADAISALINLGYSREVAYQAINNSMKDRDEDIPLADLVKESLRILWRR